MTGWITTRTDINYPAKGSMPQIKQINNIGINILQRKLLQYFIGTKIIHYCNIQRSKQKKIAFDTINHNMFLKKLERLWCQGKGTGLNEELFD